MIDVILPVMSGIELAVLWARGSRSAEFLLVSGQYVTSDLLAEAEANGHKFEILAKPVNPLVLLEAARALA